MKAYNVLIAENWRETEEGYAFSETGLKLLGANSVKHILSPKKIAIKNIPNTKAVKNIIFYKTFY